MGSTVQLNRRSQAGFTLLEILLVISLIALSVAMVVPSFFSMSDADVHDEARRMQQMLRLASEEAQLTGLPVRLTTLKASYYLESLSGDKQWGRFSEAPFNEYPLPDGIEIDAVDFAGGFPPEREMEAEQKQIEGLVGRIFIWPDGMLDDADIVLRQLVSDLRVVLQVRSGPAGIKLAQEGEK